VSIVSHGDVLRMTSHGTCSVFLASLYCAARGDQEVEFCESPTPWGTCCGDCKPCNAEMQPERDRPSGFDGVRS
jgi:hypothetical protein